MKRAALLLFAACGGSSATPDAVPADALESSGAVTVIVTDHGNPVSGLPVFFQPTAENANVFSAVTSLMGSCGFDLSGGFVTVLLPKSRYGVDRLLTFSGVKTSDTLHVDLDPPGAKVSADVDVTVASDGPGPYVLYTTCDGEPTGVTPGVNRITLQGCSGSVGMLVARIDADTNLPISTRFDIVNIDAPITLGSVYTPVDNITVTYVNTGGAFVGTSQFTLAAQNRVFAAFASTLEPALVRPLTGPSTSLLIASSAYPASTAFDEQTIYEYKALPAAGSNLTVDMAPHLDSYTNGGSFEAVSNRIVWSSAGNGTATADVARIRARFYRDDIPVGSAWEWQVIAARTSENGVQLPKLPKLEPFDFNPLASDTTTVEELTNVALPTGTTYDMIRLHGFDDVNHWVTPGSNARMIVERRWTPEPVE